MYKNIKYLIEDLQKFDVSEYDDSNVIVNDQDIMNISYDCPKTIDELVDILIFRFNKCDFTEQIIEPDMSGIDLRNLTNLKKLFNKVFDVLSDNISGVKVNLDLSSWNVTNVTNLSMMFYECFQINSLDLSGWNVSNVKDMSIMFQDCRMLKELDLSDWDTSNVTDMSCMFKRCYLLKKLYLSGWNTSNVTDMTSMFYGCTSLQFLDITNFTGDALLLNDNIAYSIFDGLNIKELKISKEFFNTLYGYKTDSIKII